ncbi:syntaxin-8 isoform X1 [Cyanistes caeruleus]|uniref:syntaxin-8 isoform X1 n=1 Tax=Cyanistes caeruleus TaxID=156563 RepID=UPI000CDA6917|nr:syntaxin-8 isoform X1 [Cyanistes caeruleus]
MQLKQSRPVTTSVFPQVNVAIRSSLQSLREKIEQLRELLLRAVSTRQITQLEGDRRQNLVDELLTRHKQLEASYRNEGPEPDVSRSSLMAGGAKRGNTNPWLLEESEETRGLGFDELRQQQRRIIEEQDAGLDALSSIISRQKQMGQEIGNELDEQNDSALLWYLTLISTQSVSKVSSQLRHTQQSFSSPTAKDSAAAPGPKSATSRELRRATWEDGTASPAAGIAQFSPTGNGPELIQG